MLWVILTRFTGISFDFYKNMVFVCLFNHILILPCLEIFEFGFSFKGILEIWIMWFAESNTLHFSSKQEIYLVNWQMLFTPMSFEVNFLPFLVRIFLITKKSLKRPFPNQRESTPMIFPCHQEQLMDHAIWYHTASSYFRNQLLFILLYGVSIIPLFILKKTFNMVVTYL